MTHLTPNHARIERLFADWHGHEPIEVRKPAAFFPGLRLPTVFYPRGGLMRLWYRSDKATPDGPSGLWQPYVHCLVIEETGKKARRAPRRNFMSAFFGSGNVAETECTCGHKQHDELPGSLATVYDGDGECDATEWPDREPITVSWPKRAIFLGYVRDWDELRSSPQAEDPEVYETRFAKNGWLVALDDKTVAVLRQNPAKVYLIRGGEFRVDARGLIG